MAKFLFLDPEFIFTQRQPRRAPVREENNYGMACLQLALMLMFAFVVLISGFGATSNPEFSLIKTRTFSVERYTQRGIPFYTSRGFDESQLSSLESQIESAWISRTSRLCTEEKYEREVLIERANYFATQRKEELLEMLKKQSMIHCDLLETFQRTGKL